MAKEHKTIKMAKRMEQKSRTKFSSPNLTPQERTKEFITNIAPEWFITNDGDGWDNPDGISCVCGQPIPVGQYWKCQNIYTGTQVLMAKTCKDYIKHRVLKEKDYRKQIEQRLYFKKKSSFINMTEYERKVISSVIEEWSLDNCIKYLVHYQDNENIRDILVDNIVVKNLKRSKRYEKLKQMKDYECIKRGETVADMKIFKMENIKLKEENASLKKENTKMSNKIRLRILMEHEDVFSHSDSDSD
jgi:hypothetical protein